MAMRKIIEIDEEKCTGCGQCVTSCAEGALAIVDGKAKVVNEVFCDGLGACIGDCPEGALRIVEREAPEFDEEAVKEHLANGGPTTATHDEGEKPCGCPSSAPILLKQDLTKPAGAAAGDVKGRSSQLVNWPVQWRLIQPGAPFFKNADLLIAADCVPFAHADFHRLFLKGRPLVMGCPKLDEQGAFLDKLTHLFRDAKPASLTVVIMEVPCCSGLVRLVQEAVRKSGRNIPVETFVVGIDGRI